MSKCTSTAGHFDGHGGAPVQYKAHCPMQHVQGYTRSHWMLPLGDYLLCIAPAAARATANKTMMKTYTYFSGHFDGHGNAPVHHRAHSPWRTSRASLEATGHHHQASIMSNNIKGAYLCQFLLMVFTVISLKMGAKQKDGPN
jgi:hypothetical protein